MIIIGDKKTYCFEDIHIPRIYINDVHQVKSALDILHKNGSLTNKEMTEETERVRSEDIREIFYLLWRLGFGIDVTKKGREIAFVENDKLESILDLEDKELKKFTLDKLKIYNPFVAILDKLIEYKEKSKKFTEKDITKDFHKGRCDGGRVDNTHPLLRWGKDEDWKLIIDEKITKDGIEFVDESKKLNIYYVHHTVDLKASKELNIIAHVLSDASFEEGREKISFDDILGLINSNKTLEINNAELESFLKELKAIGLPIKLNKNYVEINNKIYHDITPQFYVKFGINIIDGIDEIDVTEEEIKEIDKHKILTDFKNINQLILHDGTVDLRNYPENSKLVDYKMFFELSELLPFLNIKTIVLPSGWKPMKVSKINGILLSFVRFGGNLVIFHAPMGRIGSNRNLFNWLPHDLARISFVHSNNDKIKGYFTFPFGEEFSITSKDGFKEIENDSKKYLILSVKYFLGNIIFVGFKESKDIFSKYIKKFEKEVKIDSKSLQWIYRFVPSINKMKEINREFDLYPILQDILGKNFGIKFDPEIKGKPGQTDLFITSPFFCCCEVTPPNSNATGFSKVSEVNGHRDTIVFKDKKSGKKRFGDNKVGACVFGPSFTIEAGEDKDGAVDMANAMGISLISYQDLYELICLNEKVKLNKNDLERIFFNEEEKSEASIRIYELMKKLNIK